MLSKNKIKFIHSLELKKNRFSEQVFVAEGNKLVSDMIRCYSCKLLIAKPDWINDNRDIEAEEVIIAENDEIQKVSFLKTPQDVLAVFQFPTWDIREVCPEKELILMLDGVQDPGNLGTIIRLADWFGIKHIICSYDTADVFNLKVVQATMGALSHVKIYYTDLETYIRETTTKGIPIYGTFLDGKDIYTQDLSDHGILIMGNEGNGIRENIERLVNKKLFIPSYHNYGNTAESLNVAIAAAVVCAEFRRRKRNQS